MSDVNVSGFIYAHKVEKGVKIGWTTNYKKTMATYGRHGDELKEIKIVEVKSESIDQKLKKILYDLKLNVKINEQSTTEVYNLTEEQVTEILNYIKKREAISTEVVANILGIKNRTEIIKITLEALRNAFGSDYVGFRHQRPPSTSHINDIKKYIEENYMYDHFYLPPVIVALNEHKQYEVIDGMHRCNAISKIYKKHPCLQQSINVIIYTGVANSNDCLRIFRNVNKAKPVAEIYINDDYLIELLEFLKKRFRSVYGEDCITDSNIKSLSSQMHECKLKEFVSNENINKLIMEDKIKGLDMQEMFDYIREINGTLICCMENITDEDIKIFHHSCDAKTLDETILEEILTVIKKVNSNSKYKLNTVINVINDINNRLINTKVVKIGNKKIIKRKAPFVLGLFPCVSLMDIYDKLKNADLEIAELD